MLKKIISSILIIIILALCMPIQVFIGIFSSYAVDTSWEFNYTGNEQTFIVPYKGIYKVEIYGAQGENYGSYIGGKGGKVTANLQFNKSDNLAINVGGQNGYNGGGIGKIATGGGATDIRLNGTSFEDRILVAGGGGAASGYGNGGNGGNTESITTTLGNGENSSEGTGGGGGYYGGTKGDPVYHTHKNGNGNTYSDSQVLYSTSSPGGCFVGAGHTHNKTATCPLSQAGYINWHGKETGYVEDGTGTGGHGTYWTASACKVCGYRPNDWTGGWTPPDERSYSELHCPSVYTCGSPTNTWRIGCGKTQGVTVDSYNPSYGGSNYITPLALQEYTTTSEEGSKEGNGYVKITLLESYPEVMLSGNTTKYTNKDVLITATAKDDVIGLTTEPYSWNNEQRISANTYKATKNGNYNVNVINNYGKTGTASISIGIIDKISPVINSIEQTISNNKRQMTLTINATDSASNEYAASGIIGYAITRTNVAPTNINNFQTSNKFVIGQNGKYYAWAIDAVGNISKLSETGSTTLVKNLEIQISGNITWDDLDNKYNSRKDSIIHLYRKLGENGREEEVTSLTIKEGQTNYQFQTRETNDNGEIYTFRIEQELISGYKSSYSQNNIKNTETENIEINILNELILPLYTSNIIYSPIETYQNQYLKNGKIKINATVENTNDTTYQELGIHNGIVTFNVDNSIILDTNTLKITYTNTEGINKNITNYTLNGNTLTVDFGDKNISKIKDRIEIEVIGTTTEIKDYNSNISLVGKLRAYNGENTNIDLGELTKKEQGFRVEYQMPKANIQIKKVDSITEQILTDAIFTLYEWDGSKYVQKEILTDTDEDGIYESAQYEWNTITQGKYKVVETGMPKNHEDLQFSMEYTVNQLKQDSYTITPDYDNEAYKIGYKLRNPDDFDRLNRIVENEPYKVKVEIEKIDSQTKKQISANTEFTVYEWNKETQSYEEYLSYINGEAVKMERQEDGTYLSKEWLYYTPKNEGKYRIIETTAPNGYYANYDENGNKITYDINLLQIISSGTYNGQTVGNESILKVGNNEQNKMTNKRVDATLNTVIKDKETLDGISQANATLQGAKYGLYALEQINHADGITTRYNGEPGVLYKKDELVDTKITDEQGKILFNNLECGKYYIKMIEAPTGYILDENKYKVDFSYQGEDKEHLQLNGKLEISVIKQSFQLYKLKENEEVLKNAGFSIYLIKDLSIVKNEKIVKATKDTYYLNDEEAKKSVELSGKQNEDGTYYLPDLIDYYYKINFSEENKNTLPGDDEVYHPYNLHSENYVKDYSTNKEGNYIEEIRTDDKGYMRSPELAYGEYIVLETSVPREQQVVKGFIVKVEEDSRDSQELRFVIDKDFKTRVKIYTKDSSTKNPILNKDVYYTIKNEETGKYITKVQWNGTKFVEQGTLEQPFVSKKGGYFITPVQLPIGKYVLEEITAPNGYVVNGKEGYAQDKQIVWTPREKVKFEIASNTIYYMDNYLGNYIVVVEQENEEALGSITIKSQGEYLNNVEKIDENYKFSYETRIIPNIEYELYAKEDIYSQDNQKILKYEKDEKIAKIVTDENGEITIKNLPQGKYYIKETVSAEGFSLKEEMQEIEIIYKGQDIPVIFENLVSNETRQTVDITIKNVDKETKEKVAGGTYQLYTKEEISYQTGNGKIKTIDANTLLYTTEGNENGEIRFSKEDNIDLPIGSYIIKEINAPKGYIKAEEVEILAFAVGGEKEINISLTKEREKTEISIKNIGENFEKLVGAKVSVQDEQGKVITQIEALEKINKVQGLEVNKKYILKTETPALGYVTNENIEFIVEEDGTLQIEENNSDLENKNTIVINSIKTKLNVLVKNMNTQIKGVKIIIKEKETGKIVASTEENENVLKIKETEYGYYVEKLPIGKYVLVEKDIPYKEGYVEKQEVDIEVKDSIEIQKNEVEQDVSKLLIQIEDEETKEKIKNSLVQIRDKEGNIVASTKDSEKISKIKEIENGYYIERLPVGEYEILEIEPNGYKKIETQKIEIKDTKEEQKILLTTRKLIFNVEIDKKLKNIIVDGKETKVEDNNYIMKVEIKERKIKSTKLELQYSIVVSNKGETEATVKKIVDKIPEGLIYEQTGSGNWNVNKQDALYEEKIVLKPGESKEIPIRLRWDNNVSNFGERKNVAELLEVSNPYGYENKNESNADAISIVISVGTGLEEKVTIVRIIIIALTECMVICLLAAIEIAILRRKKNTNS